MLREKIIPIPPIDRAFVEEKKVSHRGAEAQRNHQISPRLCVSA